MNHYKLVTPQDALHQSGCKLSAKHTSGSQNMHSVDTVICKGQHKWNQELKNPMGGYGMYRGQHFLNLTDDYFGFVQTYEHDRGGHVDQFLQVLDFQGNVCWSYAGNDLDLLQGVVSSDKLWLFHSDQKKLVNSSSSYSKILVQLDLASGRADFHEALTSLQHLEVGNPDLKEWLEVYGNPAKVVISEKRGEVMVQFGARSQQGNAPQKIKMTFSALLEQVCHKN